MSEDLQKSIFQNNLIYYLGGKSQAEVAKAIGVSPQTFNTWCQGIAIPRMDKIQLLADYFGINKSDLIEERNKELDETSSLRSDLLDIFDQLNLDDKTRLLKIAKACLPEE